MSATTDRRTLSNALAARRPVDGEQGRQVGQVNIPVAVEVAIEVGHAVGFAVIREQCGKIGQVYLAVAVEVTRACRCEVDVIKSAVNLRRDPRIVAHADKELPGDVRCVSNDQLRLIRLVFAGPPDLQRDLVADGMDRGCPRRNGMHAAAQV